MANHSILIQLQKASPIAKGIVKLKSPNILVGTFSIVRISLVRFGTTNMGYNPSIKKT